MLVDSNTLDQIRNILNSPDLLIVIRPEWGSKNQEYRQQIRQDLTKRLLAANIIESSQQSAILDLGQTPRLPSGQVSISHCNSLGGYIFAPSPGTLGFDVEEQARISPAVIQRVSDVDEIGAAPEVEFLWVAKEAAFKSARTQNTVISQIHITSWEKIEPHMWTFFSLDSDGIGVVLKWAPWCLALFLSGRLT